MKKIFDGDSITAFLFILGAFVLYAAILYVISAKVSPLLVLFIVAMCIFYLL